MIDAVEYVGPCDDEKLGLNRVARNYHHPGWGEGGTVFHAFVDQAQREGLPRSYKAAVETASQAAILSMMAAHDARSPEALMRLVAAGTTPRAFPVDALHRASQELYAQIGASNEAFRAILESQTAFREKNHQYHQGADFQFDAVMLRLRRRGRQRPPSVGPAERRNQPLPWTRTREAASGRGARLRAGAAGSSRAGRARRVSLRPVRSGAGRSRAVRR